MSDVPYVSDIHRHDFTPYKGLSTVCGFQLLEGVCGLAEADPLHYEKLDSNLSEKATDRQVGGDHYSRNKIQPIDYIVENELDWFSGNVVKYITRFKHKNGKQDLEKVIHYAQLAIEHYYSEDE